MYIAGSLASMRTGEWKIEDGKLYVKYSGEYASTVFHKEGDVLVTGEVIYYKD